MRAFLFGLLVAGLVFWWSGWFDGSKAAAATSGNEAPAPSHGAPLDSLLTPPPAGKPDGDSTGAQQPLRIPAEQPAASGPEVDALVARIEQRESAALAAGWVTVARGAGAERERVLRALAPAADDFATMLSALGPDNSFLHSAEGRGLAAKVAAMAFAMGDAEANAAGTQLLNLMLKGRILREDQAQRALVDDIYKQHRVRVDRWLCDPANIAGARSYTVAKGDSLARIASKFRKEKIRVEEGTLAILNRIHNPNAVQVGQKIKVPVAPVHAVVEKRSFSMAVYVGDYLLRIYWVGHGENDRTPLAEFTIGVKQPRPDWTAPNGQVHPYGTTGNILGEYFIKFLNDTYVGFGAHGTPMPETICTMSSMGCIRMYAPDIEELFKLLPMGATVTVRASESLR